MDAQGAGNTNTAAFQPAAMFGGLPRAEVPPLPLIKAPLRLRQEDPVFLLSALTNNANPRIQRPRNTTEIREDGHSPVDFFSVSDLFVRQLQ